MSVLAFIQARMGSSRLPGKVMKCLNGKPVIIHIVERLKLCRKIDGIVVLTSINPENIPLIDCLKAYGVDVFAGDEENVLERFQSALALYPADVIVRITGDSPLVDPSICDQLIDAYFHENVDYAYLSERFAEGVDCEVINAQELKKLNSSTLRPSEQEHVTLHFYENNDKNYRCLEMKNIQDDSHYRYTLDSSEDWQVIEAFYQANPNVKEMDYQSVKSFFDNHPEIKSINKHIERNEGLAISLLQESEIGELSE
ncbi:glycosyltransferase family protein [Pseudoalteromonas sp. G4]|uniref:glycosyltransferase family protein n=1 Tax=Pseudoalteromonas sp. G4 TaxID=2992761 RepID=UPI00237DBDED|nr:glycosyltransferase family protein [Pseudoalteromonas sp. G4]MDE3271741.1 glycosyltransferase family protein [Pseudoalteromonas sp. G4]